jgi:proline iminopeptidase
MNKLVLGFLMIITPLMADRVQYVELNNGYKVWTKRVGRGPIQVLTLHGGPGCSHEYLEDAFKGEFPEDQFEIIFYAQLGSFLSDQPDDIKLWTVDRFRGEVEEVRQALQLENFYLYGHSWGGMLAIEYALEYQNHLRGLILSNTPISIKAYLTYINKLRSDLPQEVQDRMAVFEKELDFSNPAYQNIMLEEIYLRHLCRLVPWPDALQKTFEHLNECIYVTMQGPNEFVINGNFKEWDREDDLAKITVPTLAISGRYDTINPADTQKMGHLLPLGRSVICENGSHLSLYDDSESYFRALLAFLRSY